MWYGLESTIGGSDNTCPPEKTLAQAVRQQCELPQRRQAHKRLPAQARREVVHGGRRHAKDQPWTGETGYLPRRSPPYVINAGGMTSRTVSLIDMVR